MEHKDTKTQSTSQGVKTQSLLSSEEYDCLQSLSNTIIGAAIEVHRELGPGLLESVYEECLRVELEKKGLKVETQVDFPLIYKGIETGKDFRIDLLVEDVFIVELKAVESIKPLHEVQLLTYMKLSGVHMGLLINFNVPVLKEGIKRKINGTFENKEGISYIKDW
ncbi:MAG: GxxExxY protein [Bacteroidaceae bacterium]|nr:GxxExxY protein [Bacteroidaceae bacterium]MBQ9171286.1 GxxExxY protein [Bacteroidaceae bacterium]MBQ9295191.1 GxxExxY protein [Bacteroidaceae bacterium]